MQRWWLSDDTRLSDSAREAIAGAGEPLVSAGTLFEVSIKHRSASLRLPRNGPRSSWPRDLTCFQSQSRTPLRIGAFPTSISAESVSAIRLTACLSLRP